MRLLLSAALITALGLGACGSPQRAREAPPALVLPGELLRAPLADLAGRPVVLADALASGKKVTLVFWQAWCAPCRAEAPALVAASRRYSAMEVIGVVSGPDEAVDAAEVERAVAELGLPYRNVRDRSLDLTRALDVRGTPTIVVLDATGRVLFRGHESPDWDALL